MKKKQDDHWIEQLQAGMKKIEESHRVVVPTQFELQQTIEEYKAKQKWSLVREVIAFLIAAMIILSSYIGLSLKLPTAFLWVQAGVFISIPFLLLAEKRRSERKGMESGF